MKRLYLYLASRSKQGIKLITVLQGESIVTSRVTDLSNLKLPQIWERRIYQIIYDNRMLYEPWIEAATDFNELRARLAGRGFSDIPMGACPLLHMAAYAKAPKADTSSCQIRKTMLRKLS